MTIIADASTAETRRERPLIFPPPTPAEDSAPAPPRHGRPLARPHLLARLDAAPCLTVVSTPAGWGKTTLLACWAAGHGGRAVVVDGGRRAGFWRRTAAAVSAARPGEVPGDGTLPADGPDRLAELLSRIRAPLTLLVDDCTDVANPDALAALAGMVRATRRHRLVLACRGAPPLPLHRWRMEAELAVLSQEDLAFTIDETAGLLDGHEVRLSRAAVADLHARTEGWPTGLRLAAVSLRHRAEPATAPLEADADDLIADYLRAEVLARMDPQVRRVLTEASVAERLSPALVNALTGRVDGAAVLAGLCRQGAFVRRCPAAGDWYRLHPMLGRLLYRELGAYDQERVVRAHRRAADWYLVQGPPAEALRHLLAARDWDRAAEVLNRHWPDLAAGGRRLAVSPVRTVTPGAHPPPDVVLAMVAERLDAGDPAAMRYLLRLAADGLDRNSPEPPSFTALRLAAAKADGNLPQLSSAAAGATAHATLRPLSLFWDGAAQLHLARWAEAGHSLREALATARRRGLDQVAIGAASHLAVWHATLGRLHDAVRAASEALELGNRLGLAELTDLNWSRLALAEVYLQWNRPADAWCCADAALDGCDGDRLVQLGATVLQTRIRMATGRLAEAHDALRAAYHESVTADLPAPLRRALCLAEAELRLVCGDPAAARARLAAWRGPDPLPAHAAVIEASILLAEGRPAAAGAAVASCLDRTGPAASLTCRADAGVVAALAGAALGRRDRVVHGLEVALTTAEEQGHRRCFTAGGHRVRSLIESVAPTLLSYPPVATLLAGPPDPEAPVAVAAGPAGADPGADGEGPVEPLTSRELTVLRYLQGTLTHAEIAALLYISINTVKTHVKHIYRKLAAGSRREAVRRGRELRLL